MRYAARLHWSLHWVGATGAQSVVVSQCPVSRDCPKRTLSFALHLLAMVALGARALAVLAAPYPEQLHPFASKVSGDSETELFPAGRNDVLLFVKSSTAECAAAATAAFLAAAGLVLVDVETTGATPPRCRTVTIGQRRETEREASARILQLLGVHSCTCSARADSARVPPDQWVF